MSSVEKCDDCGKVQEDLPYGLSVKAGVAPNADKYFAKRFHFCSLKCLLAWVTVFEEPVVKDV